MALLSNGQSKASRSSHGSSDSESGKASQSGHSRGDSDSEEQRLHSKVSRSDSEHEEVSTRPAPEKHPAATPSVKKNPKSSDRSGVRNQRNLSEPNTNTPTASKSKKGVAAKRAQNDNFAEEQPESKKKKSVSTAKKAAAEDDDVDGTQAEPKKKSKSKVKNAGVVKDDEVAEEKKSFRKGKKSLSAEKEVPASNPHQKKPRKEQESAEATAGKNPEKKARVWTKNDENVIMHCYLVCSGEGLQYSKNNAQFFKKMNDSLAHKASETQLYEKVRSMKKRYTNIQNKMAKGGIKEDDFVYKSPHEKEVYKLWKQAWGEQHEEDEMELGHTEAIGDDMHQPGEDQTSAENQITAGEDQTSAGKNIQDQIIAGKDSPDQITAGKDQTPAGDRGARAQMLEEKWRELEILETQATMMRYSLLHEKCALHLESLKAARSNSRSS